MDKELFRKRLNDAVNLYIGNFDRFDTNAQVMVNPDNYAVSLINGRDMASEIEDSDEVIENAAIAEGAATEEADDYQAHRNPDFYPVKGLLETRPDGQVVPSRLRIAALMKLYEIGA